MSVIRWLFHLLQSGGIICYFPQLFGTLMGTYGRKMEPRTQPENTGRFCCQVLLRRITNNEILLCKLLECYAARPYHPFIVRFPLTQLCYVFKRARPSVFTLTWPMLRTGIVLMPIRIQILLSVWWIENRVEPKKIVFAFLRKFLCKNMCFCEDIQYV